MTRPPDPPADPPERIGPYRVVRPIARGGMAAVYEVEDADSGQRLAIKLLTQRGLARPRFQREYRALTRLDHPHIVRVYRFGLDQEERPYLTMELLDGEPAQVYAKGLGRPGTPRRTAEVIRIASEVASALAYLHERGIVHRDLKSSNVMVLADGTARLLDFGTARWLQTHDEITRHGEFVGTFAYAPPEQLQGKVVDERADLYALGVLLYRLLTGKRPFEGDSPHELARLHLEHVPVAPAELVAGVPPAVSALVMTMLDKSPDGRPGSAWLVQERLEQARAHRAPGAGAPASAPPELIGREAAVDAVFQALDGRPSGGWVVIQGAAGSGRERLLAHAASEARRRGWLVAGADLAGQPGMAALATIGRRAGRGLGLAPESAEPLALLGQVGGPAGPEPEALGVALARLLGLRGRFDQRPAALTLRALDRADTATARALAAMSRKLAEDGVTVVIFASTDDRNPAPCPDPTAPSAVVTLGPITPHQMDRLTFAVLGRRPPPAGLSRRVLRATGGMPGHAVEVLHAMIREGLLAPGPTADARHTWQDRSGGRVAIPARIAADLQLRIDALEPPARRVLDALAVAGVPVGPHALGVATELDHAAILLATQALLDSGLARAQGERLRPRLGLVGQQVREQLRESRRRLLRERLATALADSAPREGKVRLMLDAGRLQRAAEDAIAWGEQRLSAHEAGAALPLLARVADAVMDAEGVPPELQARLLLVVGRAAGEVAPGDPRAADSLEQAAERAADDLMAAIDVERATLLRRMGDPTRAHGLLQRTRQRLERHPNPEVARRVLEEDAAARAATGDGTGAHAAWGRARAASAHDPVAAERCRVGEAEALFLQGRVVEATSQARRAWVALRDLGDEPASWLAGCSLAALLRAQGRFSEALAVVEPSLDLARSWGGPVPQARLLIEVAHGRLALLRLGEVRELLSELDALSVSRTLPELRARAGELRGRLAGVSDDAAGAASALSRSAAAAEQGGLVVLAASLRAALGLALHQTGQTADGVRAARAAVGTLRRLRALPALAEATVCLQRCHRPDDPEPAMWAALDSWLQAEPVLPARVERALAALDQAGALNDQPQIDRWVGAAETCLDEIIGCLDPIDRAALRVHPWRTTIERWT